MPSSRIIGKMLVALVVVFAAMGHIQSPVLAGRLAALTGGSGSHYQTPDKASQAVKLIAATPSRKSDHSEKRHKRLLISKIFRPVVAFTIIKVFRLIPPVTDYSFDHILQRPAVVFSLRGPPLA